MSSDNKKFLISDLRDKLAQKGIKPGILVRTRPTQATEKDHFWDGTFWEEDYGAVQQAYFSRTVDSGELMLYLGIEPILDVETGKPFRPDLNLAHKFLWNKKIYLFSVTYSTFLRDFQRNFYVIKE